jgi:hypothetical protein
MTRRRLRPTKETKVAQAISDLVNDLTLDLDQVGIYLASNSHITYNRVMVIIEAAKEERADKKEALNIDNYLF